MAFKNKLFSPFYFSITPYYSVVNTAITLTYNIEKEFFDKKIITTVAFDIKDVFNKVTDR